MIELRAASLLVLATLVSAQFGGFGGYGGGGGSSGSSGSSGFGGGGGGIGSANDGNGGFTLLSQFGNFELRKAEMIRLAHGVLASAAFVFFFPVGAIAIRIIPTRAAVWIHAFLQLSAYAIYIAGFALGIWLIRNVTYGGFNWLSNSFTNYHPIIGIVVFAVIFFQPILGLLHHSLFKRYRRRTFWSYAHIWLGRLAITLGIVNGGLGLRLARNTRSGEIAYGVVAGVIWLVWVLAALLGEARRARAQRELVRDDRRHHRERSRGSHRSHGSHHSGEKGDGHHNRRDDHHATYR